MQQLSDSFIPLAPAARDDSNVCRNFLKKRKEPIEDMLKLICTCTIHQITLVDWHSVSAPFVHQYYFSFLQFHFHSLPLSLYADAPPLPL